MAIRANNSALSTRNGHLFIEECDTVELAKRFGTPLFVVSETRLRENYRSFFSAFKSAWTDGPVRVLPSIKASPLLAIQRVLTDEGAGCDVFGFGEFELAVRAGVPFSSISLNGSIKDRAVIRRAVESGARIVLDSPRELDLCEEEAIATGRRAQVLFRLKPFLNELDLPSDYVPQYAIRDLLQLIKYGIPSSDLPAMSRKVAASPHLTLLGVHAHMGRHSKRADVWRSWVRHSALMIKEIGAAIPRWTPQIINIGGGFASLPDLDTDVAIKGYEAPSLAQIATEISTALRGSLREIDVSPAGICLELEPGRSIHCDTGIHLTSVRNIKHEHQHINRTWVEVDTSQMFLGISGANFDGPKFDLVTASRVDAQSSETVDIVGLTCNLELLFHDVRMPPLAVGDILALLNTGSYIESCTRNFNALPRPGTVMVNKDQADMIKRHESIDEVFSRDVVPTRLQAARSTGSAASPKVQRR